jgi:hypothetical protein
MLCRCFGGYDYSGSETLDSKPTMKDGYNELPNQEPDTDDQTVDGEVRIPSWTNKQQSIPRPETYFVLITLTPTSLHHLVGMHKGIKPVSKKVLDYYLPEYSVITDFLRLALFIKGTRA